MFKTTNRNFHPLSAAGIPPIALLNASLLDAATEKLRSPPPKMVSISVAHARRNLIEATSVREKLQGKSLAIQIFAHHLLSIVPETSGNREIWAALAQIASTPTEPASLESRQGFPLPSSLSVLDNATEKQGELIEKYTFLLERLTTLLSLAQKDLYRALSDISLGNSPQQHINSARQKLLILSKEEL